MREANVIRVEARFLHTNELIKSIIVKSNKEIINFIKENTNHLSDYKYIKFIVRHINKRQFIEETKRAINNKKI